MREALLPVVARVLRGGRTESEHRGAVAVADEDGRLLSFSGNPDLPVYLRSTAKPFQAMPLLAAGGEKAFRLRDDEIALMCASHGGEPRHLRVAKRILSRGDFRVSDLACGADVPMDPASARSLLARGEKPTPLHNNCSGQHAGLLLACRLLGFSVRGYASVDHPLHRLVLEAVSRETGVAESEIEIAVDGCSLPVFRLPLAGLATGFARLAAGPRDGEGEGGSAENAAVRRRIWKAMCASPGMVAGRRRFTTDLIAAGHGAWIGKEGTEAVYAIGLRARRPGEKAIGIALKIEDGSPRPRDAVALEALSALGRLPPAAARRLSGHRRPPVRTVRGDVVGEVVAEVALEDVRPMSGRRARVAGARVESD